MTTGIAPADRAQAAQERIRKAMEELYGDEGVLIVRNTTNGVVSVGFGELGDKGGKAIERSNLPIVLTDEFPRDTWIKAGDFRRAVAKGWLVLVSKEEYDAEIAKHQQKQVALRRLAAQDKSPTAAPSARHADIFNDDPSGEAMVIDERTSEMVPASQDEATQRFMQYEGLESAPDAPRDNTPEGVTVQGGSVSSRAVSFCEQQRRGSYTNLDAINWLDQEEKLLSPEDLVYISSNASFESVKSQARGILSSRSVKA